MKKKEFRLGELFCGPGGLALGAKLASEDKANRSGCTISHAWGVDKDEKAIETYERNIACSNGNSGEGLCEDVDDFCKKFLNEDRRINALAFGFPCNDYSLVGKQKGMQGKYGNLYTAGIKVLRRYKPDWFIAENVSGIHSANSGEAFRRILDELGHATNEGYELTTHLYKFEEYGVPQYRHRYIIVGIRKELVLKFKVPEPTHGPGRKNKYMSVRKALLQIKPGSKNSERTKQDSRVELRLKLIPPWHNAWFLDQLLDMKQEERMAVIEKLPWYKKDFSQYSASQIKKLIQQARLKCTRARMSHIYRRLDAKRPSYTITGSGGGGTHVYHWREPRALTNRERAKIQSFPDDFEFVGLKEEVRKQIGMAVPPEGAKVIFKAILDTFAGDEYSSVPASYSR